MKKRYNQHKTPQTLIYVITPSVLESVMTILSLLLFTLVCLKVLSLALSQMDLDLYMMALIYSCMDIKGVNEILYAMGSIRQLTYSVRGVLIYTAYCLKVMEYG